MASLPSSNGFNCHPVRKLCVVAYARVWLLCCVAWHFIAGSLYSVRFLVEEACRVERFSHERSYLFVLVRSSCAATVLTLALPTPHPPRRRSLQDGGCGSVPLRAQGEGLYLRARRARTLHVRTRDPSPSPDIVPGLPHGILIGLRQALISYRPGPFRSAFLHPVETKCLGK